MSLDFDLLSHLVHGDPDRLKDFAIPDTMLSRDVWDAICFLRDYYSKHKKIPSIETLYSEKGIRIQPPGGDYEYISQQIQERAFHQNTKNVLVKYSKLLANKNYDEILENIDSFSDEIRRAVVEEKDVEDLFSRNKNKDVIDQYLNRKIGIYGVITPWPSLTEMTWGWQPGDFCLIGARSGAGKCTASHTEMYDTSSGLIITMKELVEKQRSTLSWNNKKGIIRYRPDKFWYTGKKETRKIILDNGLGIEVTPEHPFLSPSGEQVKIEDGSLGVGSYVSCASKIPFPKITKKIDDGILIVNALMTADGSLTGLVPQYSKECREKVDLMEKSLRGFGYFISNSDSKKSTWVIGCGDKKWANPDSFCNEFKLGQLKSKDKVISDFVFQLPKSQLIRWISLFFSSDGDIPDKHIASITLASKKLIYQLRHLLLRLGIYSRVKYKIAKCNGKEFDAWRLSISGEYKRLFIDTIPMVGEKFSDWKKEDCYQVQYYDYIPISDSIRKRISQIIQDGKNDGLWMYQVGHKLGMKDVIRQRVNKRGDGLREFLHRADGFSESKMYSDTKKNLIKKRIFKVFCEHYGCEDEIGWLYRDVEWEKVVSIEDAGVQDVYDVTINDGHWFVANDIVVHNTWLMLQMAIHAWQSGKKVLMVTPEMSRASIVNRTASLHLKINYESIRKGQLSSLQEKQYVEFIMDKEKINSDKFFIFSDEFEMNIEDLKDTINKMKPDIVFIDGVYLLRTKQEKDRMRRAPIIADELKQMAKRFKVPVICSTQLNREAIKLKVDEITQGHFVLSDAFAWNVDWAFCLGRDEKEREKKQMILKPLKTREGDFTRNIVLNWDFITHNFSEYDTKSDGATSQSYEDIPF